MPTHARVREYPHSNTGEASMTILGPIHCCVCDRIPKALALYKGKYYCAKCIKMVLKTEQN